MKKSTATPQHGQHNPQPLGTRSFVRNYLLLKTTRKLCTTNGGGFEVDSLLAFLCRKLFHKESCGLCRVSVSLFFKELLLLTFLHVNLISTKQNLSSPTQTGNLDKAHRKHLDDWVRLHYG